MKAIKVLIDKLDASEKELYQFQEKRVDNMDSILKSAKEILSDESNAIIRDFMEKLIGTYDTEACLLERIERYFLGNGKAEEMDVTVDLLKQRRHKYDTE